MSDDSKETVKEAGKAASTVVTGLSWAGILAQISKAIKYLKDQAPAIAIAIFNYLRGEINKKELEKKKLQLELDKKDAHEKIDQNNLGKSASDILDDAIRAGGNGNGSAPAQNSAEVPKSGPSNGSGK